MKQERFNELQRDSRARGAVVAMRNRSGEITGYRARLPRHLSDGRHVKRPGNYQQPVGAPCSTREEARRVLALEVARRAGVLAGAANWAPPNKPGVYAIRGAGGFIKIGCSRTSVAQRMKHLQTTHPVRLQFLALLSLDPSDEYSIQQRFQAFHSNGEWSYPAAPLLDAILEAQSR